MSDPIETEPKKPERTPEEIRLCYNMGMDYLGTITHNKDSIELESELGLVNKWSKDSIKSGTFGKLDEQCKKECNLENPVLVFDELIFIDIRLKNNHRINGFATVTDFYERDHDDPNQRQFSLK